MSEDLRAYFAAEVPLPDWAERMAVIDYLVGYERRLEAAEYFDEAHVPRSWSGSSTAPTTWRPA